MQHVYSGKVREVYSDGGDLLLVATDRVSVYDHVLPTEIPDKGALLTQLSVWWFDRMTGIVPNHLISATDVPAEFGKRAIRCKPLKMLPVECIVRGYLAGGGLQDYRRDGAVSGVALPPGLEEGSKFPEPIFTPSTKAAIGSHDEPITFDEVVEQVGAESAQQLRELSIAVYAAGARHAAERGVIIADTKFEFGWDADGTLTLADELLTPDSSRFWPADEWEPGRPQHSFDKQFVRDWATSTGWDKQSAPPEIPADVVAATRDRYVDVYQRITGLVWE